MSETFQVCTLVVKVSEHELRNSYGISGLLESSAFKYSSVRNQRIQRNVNTFLEQEILLNF